MGGWGGAQLWSGGQGRKAEAQPQATCSTEMLAQQVHRSRCLTGLARKLQRQQQRVGADQLGQVVQGAGDQQHVAVLDGRDVDEHEVGRGARGDLRTGKERGGACTCQGGGMLQSIVGAGLSRLLAAEGGAPSRSTTRRGVRSGLAGRGGVATAERPAGARRMSLVAVAGAAHRGLEAGLGDAAGRRLKHEQHLTGGGRRGKARTVLEGRPQRCIRAAQHA